MNQLPTSKRIEIVSLLIEGSSLNDASKKADVSINTVIKLIQEIGRSCQRFHDYTMMNLCSKDIQCEEFFSFNCSNGKDSIANLNHTNKGGWTWTALDKHSKLMISWLVADLSESAGELFLDDLKSRLNEADQMRNVYAVKDSFYSNKNHNYLDKSIEVKMNPVITNKSIYKNYFQRQNIAIKILAGKMSNDSKKAENYCYAIALHFVFYNFVKIHEALEITPAMKAGIAQAPITIEEIVNLTNHFPRGFLSPLPD